MKKIKLRLAILTFLLQSVLLSAICRSQSTNSPYSRYGLGDIQNTAFTNNIPLGGISCALQNDSAAPFYINATNPAANASARLTVFDFGVKNNTTQLETSDKKFTSNKTSLAYMALLFPIAKWWGASFGLLPYSNVGYKISNNQKQDSIGTVNYLYEGKGGINRLYLGNGFKIGNLYIGANIAYLFGDLTYISRDSFPSDSNLFSTKYSQDTRVSDFHYSFGLQYNQALGKEWLLTLGLTGSSSANINIKKSTFAATYSGMYGVEVIKDTILYQKDIKDNVSIPLSIGGGLVLKGKDKWLFGFDYTMQKWSQFKSFGQQGLLKDSHKMAFGLQFIPKKNAGPKESYYKKVFYRLGFRYQNTYLDLNNTPLDDYAITFGAGLPLRRLKILGASDADAGQKYFQSVINVGFEIGQLGTTSNQLIREKYVRAYVSFTLNDKWFMKRKFD